MQFPFIKIWYGAIYKRQYEKTLTLRKIYEYASDRAWKIFAFSHSKVLFPSIFSRLLILYLRNIYIFRSQITSAYIYIYTINAVPLC